jgi:hypothetical protein
MAVIFRLPINNQALSKIAVLRLKIALVKSSIHPDAEIGIQVRRKGIA